MLPFCSSSRPLPFVVKYSALLLKEAKVTKRDKSETGHYYKVFSLLSPLSGHLTSKSARKKSYPLLFFTGNKLHFIWHMSSSETCHTPLSLSLSLSLSFSFSFFSLSLVDIARGPKKTTKKAIVNWLCNSVEWMKMQLLIVLDILVFLCCNFNYN